MIVEQELVNLLNYGVLGIMLAWFIRDNVVLRNELQEALRRHREDLRKIAGLPLPDEHEDG